MVRETLSQSYRLARRVAVAVVGGSVVLLGVAMIVLPGPAFVVIPLGLGILALEFAWARRWLRRVKASSAQAARRLRGEEDDRGPGPGAP